MRKNSAKLAPLFYTGLVCLVWLVLAVILPTTHGTSANLSRGTLLAHHSGERFVFADLDGDRRPDLALVEMQGDRAAGSNYSIRLTLSAGTESAIGLNAPTGGLQVAARDVNGDQYLDLIITSNLDAHFVEVLLNDGSGNFAVAAPGDFPFLENPSDSALNVPLVPQADRATLTTVRSSYYGGVVQGRGCGFVLSSDTLRHIIIERAQRCTALSRSGRSPPPSVVLS